MPLMPLPGAGPRGSGLLRLSDCYGKHPLGEGRGGASKLALDIQSAWRGESPVDL